MELFNGMIRITMVSWNAIISGFTPNGNCKEVLNIFQEMQLVGAMSDSKTISSVLSTSTNLEYLEVGMGILVLESAVDICTFLHKLLCIIVPYRIY